MQLTVWMQLTVDAVDMDVVDCGDVWMQLNVWIQLNVWMQLTVWMH